MEQELFSLRAESPRYRRYEARVQRLAKTLRWAKGHWLLLTLAALLTIAAVIGFLLTVGTFTGTLDCKTLVYGENPQCSMDAFLSQVSYQYAPAEGEPVWSDTFPTLPGQYRIRAVSKNGFGQPRYSDFVTFTLLPRELTVEIQDGAFVYGSFTTDIARKTTVITGLIPGDEVQMLEYDTAQTDKVNYIFSLKALQIRNSAGQDVTACYRISSTEGRFTMTPRPITVTAADAQKVYDGQSWLPTQWALTQGTLAEKDILQVSFLPAPAGAGRHTLEPQCAVQNAAGEDVTEFYSISTKNGTLTVLPRPIKVQTGSASKVYDGTALTNLQWEILEGTPIEGHTLEGTVTGTQTTVGESFNSIVLQVLDGEGTDVSRHYALEAEAGTLSVTPIILTFTTASREKVYDGLELTATGWKQTSGTLLRGHTLSCRTTGTRTDAGSSLNTFFAQVLDADGRDVTGQGYSIQVEYGTLKITPRPITITSGSAEKLYDGYPLVCHSCNPAPNTFDFGTWDEYISHTHFTGSQTEVGSSPNTFTVEIADSTGNPTTANYSITYIYGTLTVLENPNPPETPPETPGPSQPVLPEDEVIIEFPEFGDTSDYLYAQVMAYSGYSTGARAYFRYLSFGDYTGNGWSAAQAYPVDEVSPLELVGRSLRENAGIKIHLINDCPALLPYFICYPNSMAIQTSDCYYEQSSTTYTVNLAVGYDYRDLKNTAVSSRLANLEAQYRQFVYDQYLQIPEDTKQALLQWAQQQGIRADSPTLVEEIQWAIINSATYNLNGQQYPQDVDTAVYFLTEAKEGICQHFATAATLMYRAFGIPARYTVGFVDTLQDDVLVNLTSQDAHAWVEIYVDGLGWVPLEVTGSGNEGDGPPQDVKAELYIQACSVTKTYDGKGFDWYDLTQYTILSGSLLEGHRIVVSTADGFSGSSPGTYTNSLKYTIYDENGKNVTSEYYNIHIIDGDLTILPRKITVTMGSASKVYDGTALTCHDYWISQGSLAPGHELEVIITASLVDPGTTENFAAGVRVLLDGADCSHFYEITVIPGQLEITPPESG